MTRVKKKTKKKNNRNSAYLCPHAPLQCDFGTLPGHELGSISPPH